MEGGWAGLVLTDRVEGGWEGLVLTDRVEGGWAGLVLTDRVENGRAGLAASGGGEAGAVCGAVVVTPAAVEGVSSGDAALTVLIDPARLERYFRHLQAHP